VTHQNWLKCLGTGVSSHSSCCLWYTFPKGLVIVLDWLLYELKVLVLPVHFSWPCSKSAVEFFLAFTLLRSRSNLKDWCTRLVTLNVQANVQAWDLKDLKALNSVLERWSEQVHPKVTGNISWVTKEFCWEVCLKTVWLSCWFIHHCVQQ